MKNDYNKSELTTQRIESAKRPMSSYRPYTTHSSGPIKRHQDLQINRILSLKMKRPASNVRSFIVSNTNFDLYNETNAQENVQQINIEKYKGFRKQALNSMHDLVIIFL